jgi:hypothetical protein
MDIAGGPATTICDVPASIPGGTWNKEGIIVYATNAPNSGLWKVSAAGGIPVAVTIVDRARAETPHRNPEFLPDGKHCLYFRRARNAPDYTGVYVGSVDAKPDEQPSTPLLRTDRQALFSPSMTGGSGYLLFLRDTTLFAQPFDPVRLQLSGDPVPIADQVGSFAPADTGLFSVSTTGNLGYRVGPGGTQLQLTVFDRDGKAGTVGPKGAYQTPVFSPDGTRIAFSQLDDASGRSNIWVLDTARGTTTRLTFNAGRDGDPVWSPDGKMIAFSSNRSGHTDLYVKAADGSGDERLLVKSDQDKTPTSWSRDGRWLLYGSLDPKTNSDIWLLSMDDDHKSRPFLRSEFPEGLARFSPDGRWVAYASQESGIGEIYIRPFSPDTDGNPSYGPKWMISKGGGFNPSWRSDGKELFYQGQGIQQMATDITTSDKTVQAGTPHTLFSTGGILTRPSASEDGKRFLFATPEGTNTQTPITIVLNWQAGLKR